MAGFKMKAMCIVTAFVAGGCTSASAPEPPAAAGVAASANAIRTIELDGARIRVVEQGPADAPVILLLHGFTMSLESWDGWAARLDDDYRVVRFDLLGHGMTGPDPLKRYAPAERVEVLRALMDRLGIDRAILGGNSFGGLVAWRFAARYPERVDRLILVDAGAYSINGVTENPVAVPDAMRAYLLTVPPAGLEASARRIFAHPERLPTGRLDQIRAMMTRPGNGQAMVEHLEEFTLPDPDADLARIAAPTLILWGEQDRIIPIEQARSLATAIPNARLITYPDVGHAPQEEIPERTATDVRAFLAETAS